MRPHWDGTAVPERAHSVAPGQADDAREASYRYPIVQKTVATLAKTLALHFSTLACAPASSTPEPAAPPDLRFVGAELEGEAPSADTHGSLAPEALAECRDEPEHELAAISCDGQQIVVKFPIHAYSNERRMGDPTSKVLAAVAELLRRHPEILLVRIEVHSALRPPRDPTARRQLLLETRARADVVLRELWRRHGISAERLEAVGHGASGRIKAAPNATSVVSFVIAQRARR